MLIHKSQQIWLSATTGDDRPTLACVKIINMSEADAAGLVIPDEPAGYTGSGYNGPGKYNGLAVATNSFILSIVPVILAPGEDGGLIPGDILKQAVRASKKVYGDYGFIGLQSGSFVLPGGVSMVRDDTQFGTFPNFSVVIPKSIPVGGDSGKVAFGVALMVAAAKSIGCDFTRYGDNNVILSFNCDEHGPYVLQAHNGQAGGLVAPFALIMPVHKGR